MEQKFCRVGEVLIDLNRLVFSEKIEGNWFGIRFGLLDQQEVTAWFEIESDRDDAYSEFLKFFDLN